MVPTSFSWSPKGNSSSNKSDPSAAAAAKKSILQVNMPKSPLLFTKTTTASPKNIDNNHHHPGISSPTTTTTSDPRAEAERIATQRRGKSATYTQPLIGQSVEEQEDIHSFCSEFYGSSFIFDKASEMKTLLRTYPDTLGTHYAVLVPHVISFDQFWSRYYYRCSVTTILAEMQRNEREQSALRNQMHPIVRGIVLHPTTTSPPPHPHHSSPTSVTDKTIQQQENNNNTSSLAMTKEQQQQQRTTLRAALHKEECDRDITETIQEEGEEEEDDEEEGQGIGFVPIITQSNMLNDTEDDDALSEIPLHGHS